MSQFEENTKKHIQYKTFHFKVEEVKAADNDQNIGVIRGYASTYGNIDRGDDKILPGAFTKSIERYKKINRPIKMHYQHSHMDIIGGFPIDKVQEDGKGLYVEGNINLDVPQGKAAYALAKQGVLSDMSIGFSINDDSYNKDGIRLLKELELWEISMVGEPMNELAQIEEVKAVSPFQDYALADKDTPWDKSAADKRVREKTNAEDAPNAAYRKAFLWYDAENADNFAAYKLPYIDVIDGSLKAIPRAIFAAAAALRGARGGVDIPEADKGKITSHINKYYDKLGMESPLKGKDFALTIDDVDYINNKKEFEAILRESGAFSKQAATYLARYFEPKTKQSDSVDEEGIQSLKDNLLEIQKILKNL